MYKMSKKNVFATTTTFKHSQYSFWGRAKDVLNRMMKKIEKYMTKINKRQNRCQ